MEEEDVVHTVVGIEEGVVGNGRVDEPDSNVTVATSSETATSGVHWYCSYTAPPPRLALRSRLHS